MKSQFKILTATMMAAALVGGGIVGAAPAFAAGPPVTGIDMSQAPKTFAISASCSYISVPVVFAGGVAGGVYGVQGSITSGTDYPISLSQYTVDEAPGVVLPLSGQICSDTHAGPQTITVTVQDYQNEDAAGNPTVTTATAVVNFTAASQVKISSVSGKLSASATKKAVGTADHNAIGAVVKVYFEKKGAKKYKYIGKTRVHTLKGYTTVGQWVFKSKKLNVGKMYAKISSTSTLRGSKTPNTKLVKRTF